MFEKDGPSGRIAAKPGFGRQRTDALFRHSNVYLVAAGAVSVLVFQTNLVAIAGRLLMRLPNADDVRALLCGATHNRRPRSASVRVCNFADECMNCLRPTACRRTAPVGNTFQVGECFSLSGRGASVN